MGTHWLSLVSFEGKWLGHLTVYNPRRGRNPSTGLGFLETLVREVGPAIHNKYWVARLRSRARSKERLRLVQELHDGVSESLFGLEMRIDFLRRSQTDSLDPPVFFRVCVVCKAFSTTRSHTFGKKCSA
jgi:nitrate/nitrite-specific signal transduction histidine kinase